MGNGGMDLMRLPVGSLAALLARASGSAVDEGWVRADIEAGAPTNTDGSINLVYYGAWLVRQEGRRGR
jgi:hypothetical protein